MNQSLSASTGAGSILNVGTMSVTSADASAQAAGGKASPAAESFDTSMQQANRQHSQASDQHSQASDQQAQASDQQAQGGQELPEGGELLPSAKDVAQEVSTAETVNVSVSGSDQTNIEGVIPPQLKQELLTVVAEDVKGVATPGSEGDSALEEINSYRSANLSVITDSALKQMSPGSDHKAVPFELDAGRFRDRFSRENVPASEVLVERVKTAPELVIKGENSKADESALLVGVARPGAEGSGLVGGELVTPETPKIIKPEVNPGGDAGGELEFAKNVFADSVAQIVKEAGLEVSGRQSEASAPIVGSIEEAVNRLTVPSGVVSEAKSTVLDTKNGAEITRNDQPTKVDGGLFKVESHQRTTLSEVTSPSPVNQRTTLSEVVSPPPVKQPTESVMRSADALAGVHQVAENVREQVKQGIEPDKAKGLELSGRPEALVTSFTDSLAVAGKVRAAADSLQMTMPESVRPGMPAWSQAVNDRVLMMASKNGRFAEIQLDPPELGALQIKLHVKNEQVSVVFNTPHGSVREAIEQSFPRLREMLAEQGLDLAESSVNDQNERRQGQGKAESEASFVGYQSDSAEESSLDMMHQESLSLVDYYA